MPVAYQVEGRPRNIRRVRVVPSPTLRAGSGAYVAQAIRSGLPVNFRPTPADRPGISGDGFDPLADVEGDDPPEMEEEEDLGEAISE